MTEEQSARLQAAYRELERLADAGQLTREDYARLSSDAAKAVGDATELLEGIVMRGIEHGFIESPRC